MAQVKKVAGYLVLAFVLYTVIDNPDRSGELVTAGFQGISSAAGSVGDFLTGLVD
ncbi:hypothetical protein JJV70_20730 [Streptomyces sp. JJ66]|uniref:hypothetical protein n=1 Tax=Streptomyces sp. JJ66 TaxID=2803843 RepID=UPI001C59CCB8|nr:hypothetical protein [Streptomyces sp. JJ66]MBW1604484.1 hypothetical protein [Streptomyces sp. JJ66]